MGLCEIMAVRVVVPAAMGGAVMLARSSLRQLPADSARNANFW